MLNEESPSGALGSRHDKIDAPSITSSNAFETSKRFVVEPSIEAARQLLGTVVKLPAGKYDGSGGANAGDVEALQLELKLNMPHHLVAAAIHGMPRAFHLPRQKVVRTVGADGLKEDQAPDPPRREELFRRRAAALSQAPARARRCRQRLHLRESGR